eukprot:12888390-Prorocentrum_lima.AAC.1
METVLEPDVLGVKLPGNVGWKHEAGGQVVFGDIAQVSDGERGRIRVWRGSRTKGRVRGAGGKACLWACVA